MISDAQYQFLTSPEAEAVFKADWHKADREGHPGERVAAGLAAVAERMREVVE